MTNKEKYKKIFIEALSIESSNFDEKIKYNDINKLLDEIIYFILKSNKYNEYYN